MKTRVRNVVMAGLVAVCGVGAAVHADVARRQQPTMPRAPATQSWGTATAEVLHAVTGEPLEGMPVVVQQIVSPDPDGTTGGVRVFVTGPDGRAFLSPLDDGIYEVYVEFNNNRSNVEYFEINTDTDFHPIVVLLFNPDID